MVRGKSVAFQGHVSETHRRGDLAEGVRRGVFSLALFSFSHFNFN